MTLVLAPPSNELKAVIEPAPALVMLCTMTQFHVMALATLSVAALAGAAVPMKHGAVCVPLKVMAPVTVCVTPPVN